MAGLDDLRVQVDEFEGPLSLLLQLIEREQLEVTRVSVVAVADSFLALVSRAHAADLSTIGEFVAMAARLLVIKSRALLRAPAVAESRDLEPDDADALARQIAEYRRFQHAAAWIGDRRAQHALALPGPPRRMVSIERRPIALRPVELQRAANRLLASPPVGLRDDWWPQVDYLAVRRTLLEAIGTWRTCTFSRVTRDAWHPLVVITLFLALLDTIRARSVWADQREPFGPITMTLARKNTDGAE